MVAAIGAAATIASAVITSSAAGDAADATRNASSQGRADISALLQPWITTGTAANTGQANLIGLNGAGVQTDAINALKGGPEFGALKTVGENAILANASATGGLRGGNVQAGLAQYDQGILSKLINDQYARLGGLSAQGINAANGQQQAIQTDANTQGSAEAGGILGVAKGVLGGVNGLTNAAGVFMGGNKTTAPVAATTPTGIPLSGGFGGGPVFT